MSWDFFRAAKVTDLSCWWWEKICYTHEGETLDIRICGWTVSWYKTCDYCMLFETFSKIQVFSHCVPNYKHICVYACACDYRLFTARDEIGSVYQTDVYEALFGTHQMKESWTWCSDIQSRDLVNILYIESANVVKLVIIDSRRRWCIRVL